MSPPPNREVVIFNAALELQASQRDAYLLEACADDPALRLHIEDLLRVHEQAGAFMETPAPEARESSGEVAVPGATISFAVAPSEKPGDRIGRYKLLQQIGEGGCGVVYMADQEEPVRRQVALKVIKLGMDTKKVIARFEAERQALALMDHPNIAKVLDAGATDTGRPFFVMELVRGIKITDYCDQNSLSTRLRLDLFVLVCHAIQHAHQKGIIHRDVKPSNVLVTLRDGVPVPKVIDFGIAKATTGQPLTDKTLFTAFEQFIGTPAYMSPEQAELSEPGVDTRSDIYSLGVLLYELLTGQTPLDSTVLLQSGLEEIRRIIREKEPLRPSTQLSTMLEEDLTSAAKRRQTEPLKLIHLVRGDLDWIVMKCLEKDRTRRYETANALAQDVERYLSHEAVVARPPSPTYRLQKLVQRHRTASVAVVLLTLTLLIGAVVSGWALVREHAAREQANQRLHSALVFVDEVYKGVTEEFAKIAGATKGRERLDQAGLDFVKELRAGAGNDPKVRVVMARFLIYLSEAQGSPGEANTVGDYEAGLLRAEEAVGLLNPDSPDLSTGERFQLLVRAKVSIADCLWGLGRYSEQLARLREIDSLFVQLEQFPEFAQWAYSHRMSNTGTIGLVTVAAGQPKEGIDRYLLPLLQGDWSRSITTNSSEFELETLANANGSLAFAQEVLNEFDAVIQTAGEAIRISELLARRFPQNSRHHAFIAGLRAHQGHAMVRTGRVEAGLAMLAASRDAIETLVDKDAASDHFRIWRIMIILNQARAFAFWSYEASSPLGERRQRLLQAETYLAEAETLSRASKSKVSELVLRPARAEVAAAKAKHRDADVSISEPIRSTQGDHEP